MAPHPTPATVGEPPGYEHHTFPTELPGRTQPPPAVQDAGGRDGRSCFDFTVSAWSLKAKGALLARRISMWLILLTQFVVAILELLLLRAEDYEFEARNRRFIFVRSYNRYVSCLTLGSIFLALTMTTGAWVIAIVGEARGSRKVWGVPINRRLLDIFLWFEFAIFAALLIVWFFLWLHNFIIPIFWVLLWLLMIAVACNVPQEHKCATAGCP